MPDREPDREPDHEPANRASVLNAAYTPVLPPAVALIDIDGVINVDRPCWPDPDMRGVVEADGVRWPFRWSQLLIGELVNLFYMDFIEIRWCSTWAPHASKINELFGLPPFPGCWDEPIPAGAPVHARKLACAREVLDAGRRLIWADDEAIPTSKTRKSLGMHTADALYLIPNARTGLSPTDTKKIFAFALAPYRTLDSASA